MADVVEHINQNVLEKIFERIACSMNTNGVFVVHTAPNSDYYTYTWPIVRETAAKLGLFLPQNPRSYYEELMHINEQSPKQLEQALKKYFPLVYVWTGCVTDIGAEKSMEESCRDNQIFAYACQNKEVMQRTIHEIVRKPEYEKCCVEINAKNAVYHHNISELMIPVCIKNKGIEPLFSKRQWPIYIAYHIYDKNNNLLIYDGDRTSINRIIHKTEEDIVNMKVRIPDELKTYSQIKICITLVAEGLFWLDQEGKNCKFIILKQKR